MGLALHMVIFVCVRWDRVGDRSGLSPAYGSLVPAPAWRARVLSESSAEARPESMINPAPRRHGALPVNLSDPEASMYSDVRCSTSTGELKQLSRTPALVPQ